MAYVLHHSFYWSYLCYRASSACTEQGNLTAVQAVRAAAAVGTMAGAVAAEVSAPVWLFQKGFAEKRDMSSRHPKTKHTG